MRKAWLKTHLSEVASVHSGAGFPDRYQGKSSENIPFYKVSDMNIAGNEREMNHENNSIDEETRRELGAFLFPRGSIIFPKIGGAIATNKKRVTTRPCCVDNNVMGVVPKTGKIDRGFLFYFFLGHDLAEFANDAHLPSIKKTVVESWPICLPPTLTEQQRIVSVLDEAFAGLATAQAHAQKNLQNAHALFESHLQTVFTQSGTGWVEKRLGELSRINYGYTESASAEKVGPRFLRITDIQNNSVDWKAVPYCLIEAADFPKYQLADGDIVFARTGATTGKSYLVNHPPRAVFASYLIRLRLNVKDLLPEFVNLFFQTHTYWDSIRAGVSGSAQGGFNATKLGELVIWFPQSPKEQRVIVASLDSLATETRRLANLYQQKLAALAALKKSLLQQAFSGAL